MLSIFHRLHSVVQNVPSEQGCNSTQKRGFALDHIANDF